MFAQTSGPITIQKKGLKKIYLQDNQTIDSKKLETILLSGNQSAMEYKRYKTNYYIGLSSMGAGTIAIGVGFFYSLKAAQATNDNDLSASTDYSNKSGSALLTGAGLYLASLPFFLLSNSHLNKSIDLYNTSSKSGRLDKTDLNLILTGTGVTVQLRF